MAGTFATATQLTALRAVFAATFLDTTCDIQRNTGPSAGSVGHQKETMTTVHAAVAAKLKTPTTDEMQPYANRLANKQAWIVRFPWGTDVRQNDQVVIGSQTLRVESSLEPDSWRFLTSVLASHPRVG